MKQPVQIIITEEGRKVAQLQPDFYVKTRQMALSEEFQIAIKTAVENFKSRYQVGNCDYHLHGHAVVAHLAANDLVDEIYDVFVNPMYIVPAPRGGSDFADDGEDLV